VKSPVFVAVDGSLAGSVVVARAFDWTSIEECLRRPLCHEAGGRDQSAQGQARTRNKSAATGARMAEAQRARWARAKAGK
jgi:hypothetical protein